MKQRLGEADALLVALGERFDALAADRIEVGEGDRAIDLGSAFRGGAEAPGLGDEAEEFLHGHLAVGWCALREVTDAALHRHRVLRHVVSIDERGTGGGPQESRDHLHGRRLAGAIGPEEAEDVAAVDRE